MEPAGPVSSPADAATPLREALTFALGALRSPAHVGAVAPASPWLARAVARAVLGSGCRTVVEVGAGTGALTRVILGLGTAVDRFVAIESDPGFARWLRQRFPGTQVVQGCASQIVQLAEPGAPTAIVSSLPFRSMSRAESRRCADALIQALRQSAGSLLIQYSYEFGDAPPFSVHDAEFGWTRAERILLNLPPARLWILRQQDRPLP